MVENDFIKHYGKKKCIYFFCKSDPKKGEDQKRPKFSKKISVPST